MPNKISSIEWLRIAYHDFLSASILYKAEHFTDSIGNDLQQSIEKILKAIPAYHNHQIKKSHNLIELYELVSDSLIIDDADKLYLELATEYFKEDRYPNPYYSLPPREESKQVLDFTEALFERVCHLLEIDTQAIKAK